MLNLSFRYFFYMMAAIKICVSASIILDLSTFVEILIIVTINLCVFRDYDDNIDCDFCEGIFF